MPMEAKDIFEANSKNVREMLCERGLGLYIPPYQRPYGWDREKVAKLLEDTLHGYYSLLKSEETFTFLGTVITIHDINFTTVQPIVREEVPSKVLTVIDGQQRLTTLLLLCLALHNHICLALAKMVKGRKEDDLTAAETWLQGQTLRVVDELTATFYERQAYGDSPLYPRMIRSFDDQWSRSLQNAKYHSPVARLIFAYTHSATASSRVAEFKPKKRDGQIEGEEALIERYGQIARVLKAIATEDQRHELEELPQIAEIRLSKSFQRALLNHEFPEDVSRSIDENVVSPDFRGLLNLLLFSCYLLNRVAVTVVRGKNEDYAFTVFESLNTTGEPLTAFETFRPRVVSAEGLARYENSVSRRFLDQVSNYLSGFKVGEKLQAATRDLLIYFAASETGFKLSKRLADQRRYLKDEFERYESNTADRLAFVQSLRNVATFLEHSWDVDVDESPSLYELPVEATTDAVKLCLAFLKSLGHTITIGPLVRFYSAALSTSAEERPRRIQELEGALKAMTAFSALWRASRRGTGNIDQEYRDIMTGGSSLTNLPPLARALKRDSEVGAAQPAVGLEALKAELRARLAHGEHGRIGDRSRFAAEASSLPAYTNGGVVTRLILLAAYHDAIEDTDNPGLVRKGRGAVSPCLTYGGFRDDRLLSMEHIAPQTPSAGWLPEIYTERETVHRIGNLVLVQHEANSSLSSRPWVEKRALYSALSAPSHAEAEKRLASSGFDFSGRTQEIAQHSSHMPHLAAIGQKRGDWDLATIEGRSQRLLELGWDELYAWLQ